MDKVNNQNVEKESVEEKIKKMLILERLFSEDKEYVHMVNKIKTMIKNH
ncbi:hypothetical protein SPE26_25385 [Bacillus thuringiensis]|uniref:Uncharacterized protein n=1 Tax=Bacillus thuringiensis TaxID=1428 RepID=A0AAW9GN54_BACTU|nr:hypothetical protein [Bacillus thuringiensis]MDY0854046.1 hypothetical protein [Bacillus thuringiensis]MDY4394009.1 hypothetical protein [Bacillus thuringiensis]